MQKRTSVNATEQAQMTHGPGSAMPQGSASSLNDPFDPNSLRLSQDFGADIGITKALLTVPVRKPDRQWFIRLHPDPEFRLDTAVLELKEERETYLVDRALWNDLQAEIVPKTLFTGINRQGVVFLLPARLPGSDGRHDEWNRSLFEAAEMAMKSWVRVVANMSLGAYEVSVATNTLPPPTWPEVTFQQLLKIAFKDRFIGTMDHPAVRRLRGEA